MAQKGRRSNPRTHCPACDEPLDPELPTEGMPACPACGERLLPHRAAPVGRRLLATLIDGGILLVTAAPLHWAMLRLVGVPPLLEDTRGLDALLRAAELDPGVVLLRSLPFLSMSALYLVLFWSLTGRTPGAKVAKVRVIDVHGATPAWWWNLVRVLANFAGAIPAAAGWIWALFDYERRALHDHVSRTHVVMDA